MPDCQGRIVVNRMTAFDGAQQIVGLLACSPRAARSDTERLVKPDAIHCGTPQEDCKADSPAPHIPASDPSCPEVPPSAGRARRHYLPSRDPAPIRIFAEEAFDFLQQIRIVPAVVIRKADDVPPGVPQAGIEGARVPPGPSQMLQRKLSRIRLEFFH